MWFLKGGQFWTVSGRGQASIYIYMYIYVYRTSWSRVHKSNYNCGGGNPVGFTYSHGDIMGIQWDNPPTACQSPAVWVGLVESPWHTCFKPHLFPSFTSFFRVSLYHLFYPYPRDRSQLGWRVPFTVQCARSNTGWRAQPSRPQTVGETVQSR